MNRHPTSVGGRATLIVGLAGLAALVALAVPAASGKPGGGKPAGNTFEISGTIDGYLYPGVDRVLPVRIENPFKFDVEVIEVTITVEDASPSCTAENVTVGQVPVPVLIESGEDLDVEVPIEMVADAANDCQGAVFPILYQGVATRP